MKSTDGNLVILTQAWFVIFYNGHPVSQRF